MLSALASISALLRTLAAVAVAVSLTALYCLAYNAAAGGDESLSEATAWALTNIAPWAAAVEVGRHQRAPARIAATLAIAAATVLLAQLAIGQSGGFAVVRALPGLLLTSAAIAAFRLLAERRARQLAGAFDPALARHCEWIAAAGNYIELHGQGPARLARSTLATAADRLGGQFVRVHRSYLVRRASIRRVDSDSVLLRSGRRLPLGSAYRGDIRDDELVPSSLAD
jgi:hypothetical protein